MRLTRLSWRSCCRDAGRCSGEKGRAWCVPTRLTNHPGGGVFLPAKPTLSMRTSRMAMRRTALSSSSSMKRLMATTASVRPATCAGQWDGRQKGHRSIWQQATDGCRRNDNNNDAPRSMAGGGSRRRTRRSTALPALATARGALPAAAGTRAAAAPRRRLAMFGCCCWRAESRGLPCSPPWWPWPCRPCHSCQSR